MGASSFGSCSENIEQVEERLERWKYVVETRVMKVFEARQECTCVCVNEKEALVTVKMHEVEAVKMLKGRTVHKRGQEASAGRVELGVVEMSASNNL